MPRRLALRPDVLPYLERVELPAARSGQLSVTFGGVATLAISDGSTTMVTDGFFSRPALARVALRPLSTDRDRVRRGLDGLAVTDAALVAPVHSHFDHAMDSGLVAELTGATLAGGRSTLNVGRGAGLAAERLHPVVPGQPHRFDTLEVTWVPSAHCPPDRFPGEIEEPVRQPAKTSAYRCGEAWSILVTSTEIPGRLLVQGSAGYVPGALHGYDADVVYLGVGQLGKRPASEIRRYWDELVRATGARVAVPIHWDDFFRPLDRPVRALPYLGDDLDATMAVLDELSAEDGVPIVFPRVNRPEAPTAHSALSGRMPGS